MKTSGIRTSVDGFCKGWLLTDGTLADIGDISHNEWAIDYFRKCKNTGIIRMARATIADLYSPPTDTQIRTLRELEKCHGAKMQWCVTFFDPGTQVEGVGVNHIREAFGL